MIQVCALMQVMVAALKVSRSELEESHNDSNRSLEK